MEIFISQDKTQGRLKWKTETYLLVWKDNRLKRKYN